ncbi:hypothetical protein U1Q18_042297 [Sarracenia purpurea var. burkii]
MEQLYLRAPRNSKSSLHRFETINRELGKLHDNRINRLTVILKKLSQIPQPLQLDKNQINPQDKPTTNEAIPQSFVEAWDGLKEMKISAEGKTTKLGDMTLWNAVKRLNDAGNSKEAYDVWKADANFWTTTKNKLSNTEKRTVEDLTVSLINLEKDIAVDLILQPNERDYLKSIQQKMAEIWPSKLSNLATTFKGCAWYFNGDLTIPYQHEFDNFKTNYINQIGARKEQPPEDNFSKFELVNVFCDKYTAIDQLVSKIDFHPSLVEPPKSVVITDDDIETYVRRIALRDPIMADVIRVLLKVSITTEPTTTTTSTSLS